MNISFWHKFFAPEGLPRSINRRLYSRLVENGRWLFREPTIRQTQVTQEWRRQSDAQITRYMQVVRWANLALMHYLELSCQNFNAEKQHSNKDVFIHTDEW